MKTSLDWLNSYLDHPCEPRDAESLLTNVGFPVEEQEPVSLPSGLRDMRLDVEITSNRGDCLSHVGLAREIAAASQRTLRYPDCSVQANEQTHVDQFTHVSNEEDGLCPVYTARVIRGVRVGPSPDWLVERLEAVGLRSVNNVVDVTNYVLLELGQPLHAFDLQALNGQQIVVRRAAAGEPFLAIDGSRHELRDHMLVIADRDRPLAVAGVMGGLETEVGEKTTDILLESAIFDPLSVRRTSRALKLASDSSYRFERGVDPLGVDRASRRAAKLILELAGGKLAEGVIRAGAPEPEPARLSMRPARCNALLGIEFSEQQQVEYLSRLALDPHVEGDRIRCTIPSHRLDLQREVDLIEEVGRLHGFDNIPRQDRIAIEVRPVQQEVAARQELGRILTARGYHETITFSFVGPKQGGPFIPQGAEPVLIDDERRKAEPMLRPSVLPSLLICRKVNQDLGNADVKLFETAATWLREGERMHEVRRLAVLRDAEQPQPAYRELRSALEELIERLGGPQALADLAIEPTEHPVFAAGATVKLQGQAIGTVGLLDEGVRDAFDVKTALVAAEVDLAPVLQLYPPRRQVGDLPRFPAIERDLSLIVDEPVAWQQIETQVRATDPEKLEYLRFLSTYRGKPIPKGQKSVSFRLVFRDPEKTLRHEEVDPQMEAVVGALRENINAELRA